MSEDELESVPASRSTVEMSQIVMPNDANSLGNLMGGVLMHWIDIAAAIAAVRHARGTVVTASVDQLDFKNPVRVGSVCVLKSKVNFAGRTSMECGVKVWNEDRATGRRTHVASAYLTFVALDVGTGRPRKVPELVPETDEDKRHYERAKARRAARLDKDGS